MKSPKAFLAAAAFALFAATAAEAADIAPIVIPSTPPPPPPMAAPAFDWSGPYVGAVGRSVQCTAICVLSTTIEAALKAGTNFVRGRFVAGLGGELGLQYDSVGGTYFYVGADARAGFLLGDRALLYGLIGGGYFFAGGAFVTAGGGLEFAVGNAVSIYGEVTPVWYQGGLPGINAMRYAFGVNWHPQR
jgi:opacity protein-like surface antigen